MATEEFNADEALELIKGLRDSAKSDFASFKKKVSTGAIQSMDQLLAELSDLFSLVVDIGEMSLSLHTEHMEWSGDIEDEIDALKAGDGTSALLPTDAAALKATLLALGQNLRAAAGPEDNVPALLTTKIAESITFIDSITISDEEEGEGDEDEDETEEDDDAQT
jgi:hypothetical protein